MGVIDLGAREVGIHTERSRLIGNDRHETVTKVFVLQEVLQQASKPHRGGDFLLSRAFTSPVIDVGTREGNLGVF